MIDWTGAPPFGREISLKYALERLDARRTGTPLIVEIGTSESYNPNGLGNAMLAFAFYAGRTSARIKSVDVQCVVNSKEILKRFIPEYAEIPEYFLADAFDWAPTVAEKIDFIYMDASPELASDPSYAAYAKRNESTIPPWYVALYGQFQPACFQSGCLMLFDDTDPTTYFGKGMHLIPKLLREGWRQMELRGEPVFPMALLEKV